MELWHGFRFRSSSGLLKLLRALRIQNGSRQEEFPAWNKSSFWNCRAPPSTTHTQGAPQCGLRAQQRPCLSLKVHSTRLGLPAVWVRAPLPQAPCGHVHTSCKLKHLLLIDSKGRVPCVCFYGQISLSFFLSCSPTPRKKKKRIHSVLWKKRMPTDGRFFAECCGKGTEPLLKLAMWSGRWLMKDDQNTVSEML